MVATGPQLENHMQPCEVMIVKCNMGQVKLCAKRDIMAFVQFSLEDDVNKVNLTLNCDLKPKQ